LVPGAGHSVQGDQPLALARIIQRFLSASGETTAR
jgi:pimeloyl-ACP methyl ester carboxylesterase